MSSLTLSELAKPYASTSRPFKLKYTKINSKIEKGEPFKLKVGGEKRLDYASSEIKNSFLTGDMEKLKNKQNLFVELGSKRKIRINDLAKTKEFQSKTIATSDVAKTALAESAQCLFCALVFYVYRRKITSETIITQKHIKQAMAYVDTDVDIAKKVFDLEDYWIKSSIIGANKLYDSYRGRKYVFHRNSRTVNKLADAFKKNNRRERVFGDINKWSPADIYLIANDANLKKVNDQETLKSMNAEMIKMFNKKQLVGVSLKKMQSNARISEVNVTKSKGTTKDIGRKKFIIRSPEGTIYDSMDTYVQWGNSPTERIQFRSFASGEGLKAWSGELKGEIANHGKIGYEALSFILKLQTRKDFPKPAEVATRVQRNDEKICKEIYLMAKKFGTQNLPDSMDEHMKKCYEQDPKWRYSKYLGLKIAAILKDLNKTEGDEVVSAFYYYAGSQSEYSAPHLKLEQ